MLFQIITFIALPIHLNSSKNYNYHEPPPEQKTETFRIGGTNVIFIYNRVCNV